MTYKIDKVRAVLLASVALLVPHIAQAQSPVTLDKPVPGAAAQPGATQNAAATPADQSDIQDIIVTARRTEENVQTVPVAVTALSSEALDRDQVVNQLDLQRTTPSLVTARGAPSASGFVFISIRGQGNLAPGVAADPAIGTYIDGVYIARPSQGITNLEDIQRVEVLRGPQGTLFGRNTTGGAINIISKDPTGKLEGVAQGEYGNFNYWKVGGILNVPIKGDELAVRIVGSHSQHDGYGLDPILNRPVGDEKNDFIRGKLRYAPAGSTFSLTLTGDYNKITDSGSATVLSAVDPTGAGPTAIFRAALAPALGPAAQFINLSGIYGNLSQYVHNRNAWWDNYATGFQPQSTPNGGKLPYDSTVAWGGSATIAVKLGSADLKSITGYRASDSSGLTDLDGTPADIIASESAYHSRAFSQEVQVSGAVGDRFSYIFGGYYSHETGYELSRFQTFAFLNSYLEGFLGLPAGALGPAKTPLNYSDVTNGTFGAYGQGYYKITDKLRFSAGLRWTWDTRDVVLRNLAQVGLAGNVVDPQSATGYNCVNANVTGNATAAATCALPRNAKFNYPAYTVGFDYQASDYLFLYAKHSRASKAGGWNLRQGSEFTPAFAPETAKDVEVGFKYTHPSRAFRLNVAAFNTWTDGVQRSADAVVNGLSTEFYQNAGRTRIWGAEFETVVVPVHGFEISGNMSLLNGKYDAGSYLDEPAPGVFVDRSNEPLPQLPKFQGSLGVTETIPVSFGNLVFHGDYAYVSSQWFSPLTVAPGSPAPVVAAAQVANATGFIRGYGLVNMRIAAKLDNGLEIYAFGRNLTDNKYSTRAFSNLYTQLGVSLSWPGDPATYGIGARFTF